MSEVQRRGRRGEQWVNMGREFRVTQSYSDSEAGERRVKNDVNEGIGEWGAVGETQISPECNPLAGRGILM